MDRTRIHEGIRQMRFERLLDRQEAGELSQVEAAELLGMSERSFRRWRDRLRDEGPVGLADRRLGKRSPRRASVAEISRMLELYRGSYADFTVKHFHEQLVKRHNYKLGYTVTKVHLHRAGLVRPATKRSAHRKKRPRRPLIGMMLHQDASLHAWLKGRLPKELALAGITTVEAANRWLAETYIPQHNAAFAVEPEQVGSAFVHDRTGAWRDILCVQGERTVGNDNTVKWNRLSLQLPPSRLRPHFVRATVRVHEYPDGALAVFLGPHRLADYDPAA